MIDIAKLEKLVRGLSKYKRGSKIPSQTSKQAAQRPEATNESVRYSIKRG